MSYKASENDSMFYNSDELFSHNSMINFVMSSRGGGKSFDAKRRMIKNYINKGKQSVYIRRTKTELDLVKNTFFNDIKEFFPDYEFAVSGDGGFIDGKLAIIFLPLSVSSNFKSSSYPNVDLIVFDEYVISQQGYKHYLKNEMFLLLEVIETILRLRNGRVLFLANAISYVNPLFTFFNIEITDNRKRFHKYKDGLITVELPSNKAYSDAKQQTNFAKLLKGTDYGNYAFDNEAYEDNNDFIRPREGEMQFLCSLVREDKEIGLWEMESEYGIFCDEKIVKDCKRRFATTYEDMKDGLIHIKSLRGTWVGNHIKNCFREGIMYYMNQETKKTMLEIVKYI